MFPPVAPVRSAVGKVLGETPMPKIPGRPSGAPTESRSTAKDGLSNQIQAFVTTHGEPIWKLIEAIPPARRAVNAALTNLAILKFPTRPNPLSTMADYTSWDSLTDRTYSGRHLPPARPGELKLPPSEDFKDLFTRVDFVESPKSTVLFSYFAQWFTDGFLRSDRATPPDPRKNQSSHEIDLTNLYGLRPEVARQLRTLEGGLLKSQMLGGEEYPPYLCDDGEIKPEFSLLTVVRFDELPPEKRDQLFAMGSDTSNLQVGFIAHNVLFLREHNRIARLLADGYPGWDDERVFATTRNILTVLLMKIVLEDYINHITPTIFKLSLEPLDFPNERWYRNNWMSVEFNLLYRWHSLVPTSYRLGGQSIPIADTLYNTEMVRTYGLGPIFEAASEQTAGQIGLRNTPYELWYVEQLSVERGRSVQLRSYNDYRELSKTPRVTDFDQITGDVTVQEELRRLYGHVDNIEFYVGLFAEEVPVNGVCPGLMGRMVALDAFSQVYTNPLLASRLYNEDTFSPLGMEIISSTKTLSEIVNRNVPARAGGYFVSMTRRDWKHT
ncbi:MAG TPA: peroxidase family protein [Solirubrobacteraceae bacterium]|jgi:prostaglandin-endoperoxide synthase 2|nr:peroxidase family protein [Solirubrobacteraceae bacterium]